MKKQMILIANSIFLGLISVSYAGQAYIDVYRTKQFSASDVQSIIDAKKNEVEKFDQFYRKSEYTKAEKYLNDVMEGVYNKIHKKGEYSFVNFTAIIYPTDPNTYLTIDVVDPSDASRIPVYRSKPTGVYPDPGGLIKEWKQYEVLTFKLLMSKKIPTFGVCHELHCLAPFVTPKLKKYESDFNVGAVKYQSELENILKNDKDENNRADAIFLLAHTNDKNKMVQWIEYGLDDSSSTVRNNAMRVLIFMTEKDPTIKLPIDKIIKLADGPYGTDRNKALYVLLNLVKQPNYAAIIKKNAGQLLLDNLELKQPNMHDPAYKILLAISGQHYPDRDYAAWSHWLGLS